MQKRDGKINYNILFFFFISLFYILDAIPSFNVNYLNYFCMLACILVKAARNGGKIVFLKSGKNQFIVLILIITFVVFPLIQFVFSFNHIILVNSLLYMIFTVYIMQICSDIVTNKNLQSYMIVCFSVCVAVLFYQFLSNPMQLLNLSNYTKIFDQDNRVNYSVGFSSSNALGSLCNAALVSSYFINLQNGGFIKKIFVWVSRLFVFVSLLNTGSRTSVTASVLFFVVYIILMWFLGSKKNQTSEKKVVRIRYRVYCLFTVAFVVIFSFILTEFTFEELNKLTSYRLGGWIEIIDYIGKNYLFLGGGLLNPENLFRNRFTVHLIADNWFFFMFIAYGAMGFVFAGLIEGYFVIRSLHNISGRCKRGTSMIFAFVIIKVFYSLFEIAFYTPSDFASLLMILLLFVENCDNEPLYYLQNY